MRVRVAGYLAVLDRLLVPLLPRPPMGGSAGDSLPSTLTCDAPLVGLGLRQRGHLVDAALSHPGDTPLGDAARSLATSAFASCRFGPNCGSPLELQVLDAAGDIVWFNNPSAGVRSLDGLEPLAHFPGYLYVDAYPWLSASIRRLVGSSNADVLYVNLGHAEPQQALAAIDFWKGCCKKLALQLSASTLVEGRLDQPRQFAASLTESGAHIAVVTAGRTGVAVATSSDCAVAPAKPVPHFCDSSGAGAAVAAAIIDALIQNQGKSASALAELAAIAGAAQCSVSGALDPASTVSWTELQNITRC